MNPKTTTPKNNSGFTLIETIIYIGIVAIIIGSFLLITEQIIFSNNRTRQQIELADNQKFLIQKINWLLRSVDTVNTPAPDTTSAILSVNKINFADNPLVIDLNNNAVRLTTGGASAVPITNNSVVVTGLTFRQITLPNQNAIRLTVDMQNDIASVTIDKFILIK
ncbi:MAG: prepilin-type N-terminal cleavage/methylation domain-containing protein [Patescibacteria group bacterium]